MFRMTPAAAARLASMLARQQAAPNVAMRLSYNGRGVSFAPDRPRPDDTTFEHEGRIVLLLDPDTARLVEDEWLDVQRGRLMFAPHP